jgi:transposase-like protein
MSMNDIDIKLNAEELVGLLSKKEGLGDLVTTVLNQVLEHQMESHIGAGRHEQSEERQGYRNGYRTRQLYTRIGRLTLRVPQTRDGSFCTEIFKRYQRHEQAFVLGLMEMYLQGVSTRKVTKITEALCGVSFSKSTVSQLCIHLDARLKAWRSRSLSDKRYPFLIVDALVIDVRRDDAVRATGCLVAYGINEDGMREPLDLLIADSETQNSWSSLFSSLKERGLSDVELVVSDNHGGLVSALKKHFQGAVWQRCQVHFMRNILGLSARHLRKALASRLSLVFKAEDKPTARKLAHDIQEDYAAKACKAMECFDRGLEDAIAVLSYPARYQKRLRTSNLAERVNEEIRRRQRVIRIFPNEAAAERLIGAWLADLHDQWQASVKYFDMQEFWDWKNEKEELNSTTKTNVIVIN